MRIGFMTATVLAILFILSCEDKRNIVVTGKIISEETGGPIPKAEVVVHCWYNDDILNESYQKQIVYTDQNGSYKVKFRRGHQIDVASKAEGFVPKRSYNKLKTKYPKVNLSLTTAQENPTLIHNIDFDKIGMKNTPSTPFLRVRIYAPPNATTLDLSMVETFGFDFKSLTTNTDTALCDIWYKPVSKDVQPDIIVANKHGGIIPIFSTQITSSFLFEHTTAPTTGYLKNYTLKGNEEGFFVRCRDGKTYAKLIFEKSEISTGATDPQRGYYHDLGKYFTCLYQPNGTTNLFFSKPDIDLEAFLSSHRWK